MPTLTLNNVGSEQCTAVKRATIISDADNSDCHRIYNFNVTLHKGTFIYQSKLETALSKGGFSHSLDRVLLM